MRIESFSFDENGRKALESKTNGKNWPVVYLIHNNTDLYIGETTSAYTRMGQHLASPEKQHLEAIKIVFDETFNKSVILDYEQKLIKYCKTDKKFKRVLNRNAGQSSTHNYYQRAEYNNRFNSLWAELINRNLAANPIDVIENQNIFKYSPYNSLTEEQNAISVDIINDIVDTLSANETGVSIVNGCAGTGKTVLAISIINSLVNAASLNPDDLTDEQLDTDKVKALLRLKDYLKLNHPLKIGFVFPMSGIRGTISDVFENCGNGLSKDMVLSPYHLKNREFDILFVDESHRLSRRKNLGTQFGNFDSICKSMGLDPYESNQLDWVLRKAKYKVLFYDKDQSIKSTDITYNDYKNSLIKYGDKQKDYTLTTQMRCNGGDSYIDYIKSIINCENPEVTSIDNYDFKIFDDVDYMVNMIKHHDTVFDLCRTVAGYSWPWVTKPGKKPGDSEYQKIVDKGLFDIDICGYKYVWNLTTENWISRKDSRDTIGCIHTTQGFDLNYVGVIFGEEIDYNPVTNRIEIDLSKFYDRNVKAGTDEETVKNYIINTYTTIMTRGIKGCYVYACNRNLQTYLKKYIAQYDSDNM